MKFRKKPVVIEAWQNTHTPRPMPLWLNDAWRAAKVQFAGGGRIDIHTLEGVMRAELGDWIICGVKGEMYPCKPDIFEATYEAAGLYDILEQGALVYSLPGAQPAQSREDEAVRKAWARFSNELHRSHDAPYPGMSEAFEQHFSQSFADREWRAESATWAAAWKAAKRHEAQGQPASSEGSITAGILSGMFLSLDGHDKAQPGYEWRKGWNDAIRQAMDYAQPAPSVPDLLEPLRCACNYIDKLGGVSQQYRAMLASLEAKP